MNRDPFEVLAEIREKEHKARREHLETLSKDMTREPFDIVGSWLAEKTPHEHAGMAATALDSFAFGLPKKFSPKLKKYIEDFGEENKTYKNVGEGIGDVANMVVLPALRPLKAISSLGKTKYAKAAWESIKPVAKPAINKVRNLANKNLLGKLGAGALENAAYGGAYGGLKAYGEDMPIKEGLKTGAKLGAGLGIAMRIPRALSGVFNKSKRIQNSLRSVYPNANNASEAQRMALKRADEAIANNLDMIANADVDEIGIIRGTYFDKGSRKARALIEKGKDEFNQALYPRSKKVIDDMFPRTPNLNDFSRRITKIGKKVYPERLAKVSKEATGKEIMPSQINQEEVRRGTALFPDDPFLKDAQKIVEARIGNTENLITKKIDSLEYWDEIAQELGDLKYQTLLSDPFKSKNYGIVRDKVVRQLDKVTDGKYSRRVSQAGKMYKGTQSAGLEGLDFLQSKEGLKKMKNSGTLYFDPKMHKEYYDNGLFRRSNFRIYKKAYKAGVRENLQRSLREFAKAKNADLLPKVLNRDTKDYLEAIVPKELLDTAQGESDKLSRGFTNYNKFSSNSSTAENVIDSQKMDSLQRFLINSKRALTNGVSKLANINPQLSSESIVKYFQNPREFKKAIANRTNSFQRILEDNPRILESILRKIRINEELRKEKR